MELKETNAKVIIISGKARAGKDTTGSYLKEFFTLNNKTAVTIAYADYIKMYAKKISDWDGKDDTKPRTLLQELGTEIIRNRIDQNFFIKRIIEDIKVYSFFFDYVIITDARIEKEITKIKEIYKDVISLNIERPNFVNELSSSETKHITETGLDNFSDFDHIIINDGTLEDLKEKASNLGEKLINE